MYIKDEFQDKFERFADFILISAIVIAALATLFAIGAFAGIELANCEKPEKPETQKVKIRIQDEFCLKDNCNVVVLSGELDIKILEEEE